MERVLVLNAGSSTLKFAFYVGDEETYRGALERIGSSSGKLVIRDGAGKELERSSVELAGHEQAVTVLLGWLDAKSARPNAVGHRVVHGGDTIVEPTVVDAAVKAALNALVPYAPLHQPHNLAAIEIVGSRLADCPQVVCADTAFHRTLPAVERVIALPGAFPEGSIRRYGFHGLSYEHVARELARIAPDLRAGKVIACHLGSGCSICGMVGGSSRATSMGFTALEGVPMGTRPGSVDPGMILYMLAHEGRSVADVTRILYEQSGLRALSGGDADMRDILRREDDRARLAIEFFCYRVAREIASTAVAVGGMDALVFTGGIGEHAAPVRAGIVRLLEPFGAVLDGAANNQHHRTVSQSSSSVVIHVLPTDEELVIARGTRHALSQRGGVAV